MQQNRKIGIVTVLYNSATVLEDFFRTLDIQTYKNFILYIVDNKSPDTSLAVSKKLAKSVSFETKFIENDDNLGVAAGNNVGIYAALKDDCDYILLSNNDVILNEKTIETLLNGTEENKADLSVPKIYIWKTNRLWCAGGDFNKRKAQTQHFGYDKEDDGSYDETKQVNYAPTCFMLINKSVFEKVGYMDEKYFVYYDDTDFIYRTQKQGLKLYYIPSSTLIHKESVSTGKKSDFFYHYMFRNRLYFVRKHYKAGELFVFLDFLYHFTVRRIRLLNNNRLWKLIYNALKEGAKL